MFSREIKVSNTLWVVLSGFQRCGTSLASTWSLVKPDGWRAASRDMFIEPFLQVPLHWQLIFWKWYLISVHSKHHCSLINSSLQSFSPLSPPLSAFRSSQVFYWSTLSILGTFWCFHPLYLSVTKSWWWQDECAGVWHTGTAQRSLNQPSFCLRISVRMSSGARLFSFLVIAGVRFLATRMMVFLIQCPLT